MKDIKTADIVKETIRANAKKIYNRVKNYPKKSDDEFNSSAESIKVLADYNLVIWCDINEGKRCFLISIRYNPFDELFGEDIGVEWESEDTSNESFNIALKNVLRLFDERIIHND